MISIERLSNPPRYSFVEGWYDLANADHFWMQWRWRAFLGQARTLSLPLSDRWRGLDIGCGAGIVCRQIEQGSAWTVDGTDLDENALSRQEDRKGRALLYDIFDRRSELEASYDFLVLFDVLEHIPEPTGFLEAALFHLKRGGWLFINVPAFHCLMSDYDKAAGHVRRYDRVSMKRELKARSLEIRDMRYWGASMLPLLFLRKLFVSRRSGDAQVIRKGFQPPGPLSHSILKKLMLLETEWIAKPLAGTSLLAAAVKQ